MNPLLVVSYYEDIWIDLDQLPTARADIFAIVKPQLARKTDLSRSAVRVTFPNVKRVSIWHKLTHALLFYLLFPYYLCTKKAFLFIAPPYFHFLAVPLIRFFGKKVLTVVGDAYSEIAFEPLWQASWFTQQLRKLLFPIYWLSEYIAIAFSNETFAVSTYLVQKYARWSKTALTPNGAPVADIHAIKAKPVVPEEYVYYMGGLLKWRGIDLLMQAFQHVKQQYGKPLKLVIVGGHQEELAHYPELRDAAEDVVFTGRMSHDDAIAALKAAKIAVLPNRNTLMSRTISSIKVFEYIAAGIPQVCTDTGDHADWVRKTETGVVVQDSAEDLAAGMLRLLTDGKQYAAYARNCTKAQQDIDCIALRAPIVAAVQRAVR
jgi:glycosyltransferase involved in cell wall biosynthesis